MTTISLTCNECGRRFNETLRNGKCEFCLMSDKIFKNKEYGRTSPTPPTFVERIKLERDDLETKHKALKLFMMTGKFNELSRQERHMLDQQALYMNQYLAILNNRLAFYGVWS